MNHQPIRTTKYALRLQPASTLSGEVNHANHLFTQESNSPLGRQRGVKKCTFLLRNVANKVYFQGSMPDPAGRDRGMKMSWDELQLVPPTTSKLKVALQVLFSEEIIMPLYEYMCLDCSSTFERRRSFAQADEPAECPTCEGNRTRKAFASIALIGGRGTAVDSAASGAAFQGGCGCGAGMCGCQH